MKIMNIMRSEYPRPDFVREDWLTLNGEWDFEIDNGVSGKDREFFKRNGFNGKINVPFCPESSLSGVSNKDFMYCVWYGRSVEIPENWNGKNVIIHFGAADYRTTVYVNGKPAGEHSGGYTPFSFDITELLNSNGNYITVCCEDDVRSGKQPCGKQSDKYASYGCDYTRTTGIWQSVWLEAVNSTYIEKIKTIADISTPSVGIEAIVKGKPTGSIIKAEAFWEGKSVGTAKAAVTSTDTHINIPLSEKHLWEVGKGNLYDLKLTLEKDDTVIDSVTSYFGLRTVSLEDRAFKLNGETVFGRWVLDQGFYPDGIYTAPTVEALEKDILYSMELGFNGARLHEKVFEPYFLYYADKHGYMVWGEHANWALDITTPEGIEHFLPEWLEAVDRDFNHPSIIGWCPFNETTPHQDPMVIKTVYLATKAADRTRIVNNTSGWYHVIPEIYDVHNYEQNPAEFNKFYCRLNEGILEETPYVLSDMQSYDGKLPVFVSEYGGAWWSYEKAHADFANANEDEGWGYGDAPKTPEEFLERYKGLTEVLLHNEFIMGFCYTQLYDVEQEQNGLMTYDRKFKFDPKLIREINSQPAAIERK